MRRPNPCRSLPIALFATLLATSALAAAPCAAMFDCPMKVAACGCPATSGVESHCPSSPSPAKDEDCPGMAAAEPAANRTAEAPTPLVVEAPEPVGGVAVPVAPSIALAEEAARGARPAGRALLSLHQSLLI